MIDPGSNATWFLLLLGLHVLAGLSALGAGAVAIVTRKGSPRHNAAGRAYVYAMAFVVLSAAPLAVAVDDWFLLAIAVFSGYLVFGGYRIVRRRRRGLSEPTPVDYAGHGTMFAVGCVMVGVGGWGSVTGRVELAPVLAVFGAIGCVLAAQSLYGLLRSGGNRRGWLTSHVGFMGGAYIATVTATVTVNLTSIPPIARWLGPTAIGVPLIAYGIRTYESRFGISA